MKDHTNKRIKDQSGQTLVEFVLLMAGIVIISLTFMRQINGNIASRWEKLANVILEDDGQKLKIR